MRRTRISLFLSLIVVTLFSGCVSFSVQTEGNPITEADIKTIEVGKTTRAQVLELLGSPLRIDRTDITGLAERALANYEGEQLTLKIDPSLFEDVYIYERREIDRMLVVLGLFNYATSDERSDRLSLFFDKKGVVLGLGWTPGREGL
jgi:hypothetical protein